MFRHDGCPVRHRSWRTLAGCIWRRAEYVTGDGPWALLTLCPPLEVSLHQTEEEAVSMRQMLDRCGCCGSCVGMHRIVNLSCQ